jgi:hypothetical protein
LRAAYASDTVLTLMSESPQADIREVTSQLNDLAVTLGLKMDTKVKRAMRQKFLTLLRQADELIKREYED